MEALKKEQQRLRISQEKAESAVRDLLIWAGDNPDRGDLKDTPKRVVKAFREYFAGYEQDPREYLTKTFDNVSDYSKPVILRNIDFRSHCEHHLAPIIGKAHIAYLPQNRVVGISKLARIVEIYAKRLQIQERMTADIATTLHSTLDTRGVMVLIEAEHHCMVSRGINKPGSTMITMAYKGVYEHDLAQRQEIISLMGLSMSKINHKNQFGIDTATQGV